MVEAPGSVIARRIAVLIDGDNAQPSLLEQMLAEASKYGQVTIRRIYGDWTMPDMSAWKDTLHLYAIHPIQQFRNTIRKNATDSALIIDAMDILYDGIVNAFCLVSSDSDFTRLATRIREKGLFVMGMGKQTTPRAFVKACEVFVYTENLVPEAATPRAAERVEDVSSARLITPDPLPLLKRAFDMAVQEDGWASLGAVGTHLRQLDPGFDPRTYGCKQLWLLIRKYPGAFEVDARKTRGGPSLVYVKLKE